MKDSNMVAKDAEYAFVHGYGTDYNTSSDVIISAEMLREKKIENLLGILNNPWIAQRMSEKEQESIIETLKTVAMIYNDELRNDPTIKASLPSHERIDELNSLFK